MNPSDDQKHVESSKQEKILKISAKCGLWFFIIYNTHTLIFYIFFIYKKYKGWKYIQLTFPGTVSVIELTFGILHLCANL